MQYRVARHGSNYYVEGTSVCLLRRLAPGRAAAVQHGGTRHQAPTELPLIKPSGSTLADFPSSAHNALIGSRPDPVTIGSILAAIHCQTLPTSQCPTI